MMARIVPGPELPGTGRTGICPSQLHRTGRARNLPRPARRGRLLDDTLPAARTEAALRGRARFPERAQAVVSATKHSTGAEGAAHPTGPMSSAAALAWAPPAGSAPTAAGGMPTA